MRITHVTQATSEGVAVVVASLARHQAALGHQVTVICPSGQASGPLVELRSTDGVRMVAWRAGRQPDASVFRETRELRRLIRGNGAQVVVLHSAKAGLAGRLAVRGRIPTVYAPHAWSFEAATGFARDLAVAWERFAQRWTHVTVCVSRDEHSRGVGAGIVMDATVIANGVDTNHFVPGSQVAARADLGLPDSPTLACVGRLTRQKGQDRLLAAWPAVLRRCPDAQLVIVGDGPDRARLEAAASAQVHFVGAAADPRPYLLAADAVAVPSRWEAGALVPLEAMASGRAVVAVDVTGLREVLGADGTITPSGDDASSIGALADAIVLRLNDIAGTLDLGRRSRRRAVDALDVRRTLRSWDRLLLDTAGVAA